MNRRQLLTGAGATAAAGLLPAATRPPALMKLGCQSAPTSDQRLQFFARHGVEGICGYPAAFGVDDLSRLRERCEKWKVSLDCIAPGFLESTHIDKVARPAILLGASPQRDRDIADLQNTIHNCAAAGIPSIKYNLNILGVLRTERTPGRGGTTLSTWNLERAKTSGQFPALTRAGRVRADLYWERISYFLERVIPVANEYRVRMACHPHDPGVPPVEGFEGVDAVLGTVDGLKQFLTIQESPYHGLNFCQGTVSEMLADPGKEIFDVIRYFGTRKKIFNVHFRNIRGHRDAFQEVYPDEGDVDFVKAMRVYREIQYPYMLMPDHVPYHADDPTGDQAFAFSYGYIRALIQAAAQAS